MFSSLAFRTMRLFIHTGISTKQLIVKQIVKENQIRLEANIFIFIIVFDEVSVNIYEVNENIGNTICIAYLE